MLNNTLIIARNYFLAIMPSSLKSLKLVRAINSDTKVACRTLELIEQLVLLLLLTHLCADLFASYNAVLSSSVHDVGGAEL